MSTPENLLKLTALLLLTTLTACGGGGGDSAPQNYTVSVSAIAGTSGVISPASTSVAQNGTTSFALSPGSGYGINTVSGCGGTLVGNTYTTGASQIRWKRVA